MIKPELPPVRQRDVEARRGPGWPALVEPLISGSVLIERYFVAGLDKAMSRQQPGLARTDNCDIAHDQFPGFFDVKAHRS